jgi:hypothetical protein
LDEAASGSPTLDDDACPRRPHFGLACDADASVCVPIARFLFFTLCWVAPEVASAAALKHQRRLAGGTAIPASSRFSYEYLSIQ